MKNKPTVLILCGGKGERLRPLTETTPKPLVQIRGQPILSHLLGHLRQYGLDDILVAAGFQAEKIQQYFRENHLDLKVRIVDSGDVDIIERIKACAPYIQGDFLLLYGDTLANVNLDQLQMFHSSHPGKATITLWPLRSQFGLAELDSDGNVTDFKEKPVLDKWINIGHFYFDKEVLSWMKEFNSYAVFLESLSASRKLRGYKHDGVHITVNTLRELEEAERDIDQFRSD